MKSIIVSHRFSCLLLLISALLTVQIVHAASLKNLLFSPGELISAHQKFDDDCQQCHSDFSKDKQSMLCQDCHDQIASDLKSKTGFHGLSPDIKDKECKSCHADHQGRDFDSTMFDLDIFKHQFSNFPLKGKHQALLCSQCHSEKNTFRMPERECIDCHKKQDIHQGNMGTECADCHTSLIWSDTDFDHMKTSFPLRHSHINVSCNRCHLSPDYKEAPKKCVSCHVVQDIHAGKMKDDCGECHNEKSWTGSGFDHAKTDFPLKGKHQILRCESCHTAEHKTAPLPTACSACHALIDIHKGEFGRQCENCHSEQKWLAVNFNHSSETDFPLTGKHKFLSCQQCHGNDASHLSMFAGLHKEKAACFDCHQQDDSHQRTLGSACENCHEDTSWSVTRFNHDLTRFPLIGMHKSADCQACHISDNFKETKSECHACHQADDPHKPSFGKDCQSCHNPNDWRMWSFDHQQSTSYSLEGAHKNLQCDLCHSETMTPSSRCYSCHRQDDIHRGAFGQQCQQCHTVDSFHTEIAR